MGAELSSSRPSYHQLRVRAPYRLDLTVTALRRLPTNVVDILTADGDYLRLFEGRGGLIGVRVRQTRPDRLSVRVTGARTSGERRGVVQVVRGMLGLDRDLSPFYEAARHIPWLRPLLEVVRGIRPPRYPTLWESFVRVVLFQQISLEAASTITRRLVEALGEGSEFEGERIYAFPGAERVLDLPDSELRSFGISPSKAATLRRAGSAIIAGELREEELEALPTEAASQVLQRIKGIGPWSATVILLRGLGRLDLFPGNDTSVASNLDLVTGGRGVDLPGLLDQLGDQRGMLYYTLLLARLRDRGLVGNQGEGS